MTEKTCTCKMQGRLTPSMCEVHGRPHPSHADLVARRKLLAKARVKVGRARLFHDDPDARHALCDVITALEMVQLHDESIHAMKESMRTIIEQGQRLIELHASAPRPAAFVVPVREHSTLAPGDLVVSAVDDLREGMPRGTRMIVEECDDHGRVRLIVPGYAGRLVCDDNLVTLRRRALEVGRRVRFVDGLHEGRVGTVVRQLHVTGMGVRAWCVDVDDLRTVPAREDFLDDEASADVPRMKVPPLMRGDLERLTRTGEARVSSHTHKPPFPPGWKDPACRDCGFREPCEQCPGRFSTDAERGVARPNEVRPADFEKTRHTNYAMSDACDGDWERCQCSICKKWRAQHPDEAKVCTCTFAEGDGNAAPVLDPRCPQHAPTTRP